MESPKKISVVGLGYVGLPLAIALAHHYRVVGYDLNAKRIDAISAAYDATGEVSDVDLAATSAVFSADPAAMRGSDVFIITVPTPVNDALEPDLTAVRMACSTIGKMMSKGATIVLESTVYPGVTEEICADELERSSGLSYKADFRLGYSPERMNPGDKSHSLLQLTKVVAGDTAEVAAMLAEVYGRVTGGKVFVARDIRTAEAAKVIENAQRDINIAFVNEVAMIFGKMGLSVYDVLDAARTKWNFLPFTPGLVGGHCIGVDPYYLAHKATSIGHDPEVILAGRRINNSMGVYIAQSVSSRLKENSRILLLGLTFKENVPDLRNSRVMDILSELQKLGHHVDVHDPLADREEALDFYGISLMPDLGSLTTRYDAIVGAVPHRTYTQLGSTEISRLLVLGGLLADVKGIWRLVELPPAYQRWCL